MNPTTEDSSAVAFTRLPRVLGAINALVGIGLAVATARAVSDLARRHIFSGLRTLIGVLIVGWILKFVTDELTHHFSQRIRNFWRGSLHRHFSRPRAEGQRGRGDLALAVERASEAPALLLLETSAQVSAIGIGVVFWAVGWPSTLITMALVLLSIPLYQRAGKRSEVLNAQYYERRSLLETRQLELLQHAPELRALGAVAYGAGEIAAISDSEHVLSMRAIRVALESSLVTEFLSGVSIGLVAMIVGFELLDGRLKLLHALVAVLVTSELFIHIRRYGAEFHRREDAATSMSLLEHVHGRVETSSISLLDAVDLVCETSLSPVNLTVTRGERILVTGASGVGKTTLLHTLVGWRSALAGSVGSSGQPIGFVSAETQLLSGSLWANLTLGAELDPVIVRRMLDNLGLDSPRFSDLYVPLLADGRGLSSGERTRLVLARCLLAHPPLIILDDVAGVLDAPSRDRVRETLENLTELAIIEATVDSPLLTTFTHQIEITR